MDIIINQNKLIMTITQCIQQIKSESSSNIFEIRTERKDKTVKLQFICGLEDDYRKLKNLLTREGYKVLS